MKSVSEQSNEEWVADYDGRKSVASSSTRFPERSSTSNANKRKQRQSSPRTQPHKVVVPKDLPVLIPEGSYQAKCYGYRFSEFKGTKKIVIEFDVSEGRYTDTHLKCFYNLDWRKCNMGEYTL